jgi:hypothetical protein
MEELIQWLEEQTEAMAVQHSQLADDRLVLQGRHEACGIVLQKIAELADAGGDDKFRGLDSEALDATSTDEEEAAAEAGP